MPLNWNEICQRAITFSREWADASSERAEAQTFWNEFFHVFGKHRRTVATFEESGYSVLQFVLLSSHVVVYSISRKTMTNGW